MLSNTMRIIARQKYQHRAEAAVRAEQRGDWQMAASLWSTAEECAWGTLARIWARARHEFCVNAANRGWEVRRESC